MYSFVWLFTSGNGRGVSGGSGCGSDSVAHGGGEHGFWEFKLKSFSEANTFTHGVIFLAPYCQFFIPKV